MADEARRAGWRVVAFAFDDAPGLADRVDRLIPAELTRLGAILQTLLTDRIPAVLFSGRFSMPDVLRFEQAQLDATVRGFEARAGSRVDARFVGAIIETLGEHGIEVLDQRGFVGDWFDDAGCWSARRPSEAEWRDVRHGLDAARTLAAAHVGQTVVVRHGVVVAVEAVEGTTETVRRGAALGGPGSVVVKVAAPDHDYRFDAPAIGPETLAAAAEGGVAVIAFEARRVMLVDRAETLRRADGAGIAVVGVDGVA
jgi:DUF1009 family protein